MNTFLLLLAGFLLLMFISAQSLNAAKKRALRRQLSEMTEEQREECLRLMREKAEADKRILEMKRRETDANGKERSATWAHGPVNAQIVCPHCQVRGKVRTKEIERKAGISGGKATAAVITGGLSVLATGLSRKELLTQAHCENCTSTWTF